MPVYLNNAKFSQEEIGLLLNFGPDRDDWSTGMGSIGDRAKSKNQYLRVLIIGSGISIGLLFSHQFIYLLVLICIFTFFQTSIFALSDAITLEEIRSTSDMELWMDCRGGTVWFATTSLLFGFIAKSYIGSMFLVYACTMVAALLCLWRFPAAAGRPANVMGRKFRELFKNGKLIVDLSKLKYCHTNHTRLLLCLFPYLL